MALLGQEGMNVDTAGEKAIPVKPPDPKPSFKDKVLGSSSSSSRKILNLVQEKVMSCEHVGGNPMFPMYYIDEEEYQTRCQPWKDCLVVKLLGKNIGFGALSAKLRALWKLAGGYELRDINYGYFLVKFDPAEDKEKVMTGAPWVIFYHYLSVKPWTPDFVAADSKISTTLVWIRIPGLGFQFYDESILCTLATSVGNPIRVDMNTVDMQRGNYSRICVEIDLNKPVLRQLLPDQTVPRDVDADGRGHVAHE